MWRYQFIEQKEIDISSTSDDAIFYQAKKGRYQSDKIMIDLHNRSFTTQQIIEQTYKIFTDKETDFVNIVIYTKDGKQIWRIFQKMK